MMTESIPQKNTQKQMNSSKKSFPSDLELSDINYSAMQNASTRQSQRLTEKRKYGNMIVIVDKGCLLVTLGPDYICSIIAIIIFGVLDYFTVYQIFAKQGFSALAYITAIGSIIQVLSYFAIMVSNPGIVTSQDFLTENDDQKNKIKRFCNICNLPMLPRSRHCSDCNVCIKGYDHHCPWTSKCIGSGNLWRFYFFASYTPLYLIYNVIVISII